MRTGDTHSTQIEDIVQPSYSIASFCWGPLCLIEKDRLHLKVPDKLSRYSVNRVTGSEVALQIQMFASAISMTSF